MKWKEQSIKSRLLLAALGPGIATSIALTFYFALQLNGDVGSALQQHGITMARLLAPAARYQTFSANGSELNQLLQGMAQEADVSAITIYGPQGTPLAAFGKARASPPPLGLADGWQGQSDDGKVMSFHSKAYSPQPPADDPAAGKTSMPARNLLLGSATIELSRDGLLAKKREILLVTLAIVGLILLVAAGIAHRFGRDISRSILTLEDSVKKIREGLLTSRVEQHPSGPLHGLEEAINAMAATLEQSRQQSKQALSASNAQLQQQSNFAKALLEAQSNAGMCMIIIEDGRILSANEPALELIGVTGETIDQLEDVRTIILAQDRPAFIEQYQQILEGQGLSRRIEVGFTTYDGSVRWAEIVAFEIKDGPSQRIAIIGVDITLRKLDAEKLQLTHQELQHQKEAAERTSIAKSRFVAAAGHDLRQPVHALSLFSDQLQKVVTTAAQARLVEQIGAAIGNLSELLESLLDISKLDLVSLNPEIRAIALEPFLNLAAETHRHSAEKKKLRLVVAPTSLYVLSDARYLSRIIANLVSNAVRYTHHGGVVIGARRAGQNIRIEIWDTGIGIEPEHIPLIFQEFYQVANAERDKGKGLGLGLAIVKGICTALGYRMLVRSKFGCGSVFGIQVPRGHAQQIKPDSAALGESDALILLAIADLEQRSEFTSLVKRWGYKVLCAAAGEIENKFTSAPPDLILCDAPCAAEVSQTLRLHEASGIPVILLKSRSSAIDLPLEAQEFTPLEPPLKPAKLRALMLHLLTAQS